MSTGLIIAIVVVALIVIALLVMLPRMRANARRKQAERELHARRSSVAGEQREAALQRESRAERAEQQARIAEQEARRERAEADLRRERAEMHERGMADDELIDDSERDRFAGVTGPDADGDGHTLDDRARAATDGDPPTRASDADSTSPDYDRGREDERRFERNRLTDDVRESERSRER